MASDILTIQLPEAVKAQLQSLVKATGKSESEVVGDALKAYFQQEVSGESSYEVAQRAGFVGADEGGPDDLSVNPAHMEGFGRE